MHVAPQPVSYIDQEVPVPANHVCSICLEGKNTSIWKVLTKNYFITHPGGEAHADHLNCVREWLKSNSTCPQCRVPINNTLASRTEKIVDLTKASAAGADLGMKEICSKLLFGAATAAAIAGLTFAGTGGAKSVLALVGTGCLPAALWGIYSKLAGPDAGTESRLAEYVIPCSLAALAVGVIPFITGLTKEATVMQAAGVFGLLYSAGKTSFVVGSSLGAMIGGAVFTGAKIIGTGSAVTTAAIGSFTATIIRARKSPILITLIAAASAYSVGQLSAGYFANLWTFPAAVLGGTIGALAGSTIATHLELGYNSYKQNGFNLF